MADYTPSPRAIRAVAVLVRLGHRAWLAALVAYVVLVLVLGLPHSPELGPLETPVQVGLLVLGVVAGLVAFRSVPVGGTLLVFGAVCLGVMASLRYPPALAFVAVMPFFLPGLAYVAAWIVGAHPRMVAVASLTLLLLFTGGGLAAATVHNHYHGAAHPQSEREALEQSAVNWVWSGGITADSATVVASVEPGASARLHLDPASADSFGPVVADGDGVARFELGGLSPMTAYGYVIEVDGERDDTRSGAFTTISDNPMSFSVAAGSCARSSSNGQVFEAIREADPTLFLITGDIHYGNFTEGDPDLFRDALDASLTQPAPAALYRSVPVAYIYDDHDFGGNDADSTSPSRPAVLEVYRQYVPDYGVSDDPEASVYQAWTIGRVRFIITDIRADRDPKTDPDGPSKTMLGAEQKAWFKAELLAARDGPIVWINPVPWIGEARAGADTWAGYSSERAEIADFIAANDIDGIVMVSGDAHMIAIDDGTNSNYATSGGAGFPIIHAAALDRPGGTKGGPYSEGAYPGGGQWALITFTDDGGDTVTVTLSGRDWTGTELVGLTVELPAG